MTKPKLPCSTSTRHFTSPPSPLPGAGRVMRCYCILTSAPSSQSSVHDSSWPTATYELGMTKIILAQRDSGAAPHPSSCRRALDVREEARRVMLGHCGLQRIGFTDAAHRFSMCDSHEYIQHPSNICSSP